MKKIIGLIAVAFLVNSTFADVNHSPVSIASSCEIVDVNKIYALKSSSEADSNLVFTITRFTYFEISDLEIAEITADIKNNILPTSKNRGMTFSQTHNAYDESKSHPYTGTRYLAIEKEGYEVEFIVFWVEPSN